MPGEPQSTAEERAGRALWNARTALLLLLTLAAVLGPLLAPGVAPRHSREGWIALHLAPGLIGGIGLLGAHRRTRSGLALAGAAALAALWMIIGHTPLMRDPDRFALTLLDVILLIGPAIMILAVAAKRLWHL